MANNAPKNLTWIVAVVLGVLGIVSVYVDIPVASDYSFWLVTIGFALLAIATKVRGL